MPLSQKETHSHDETRPLDYNAITDEIFIGTNQCCQTHFDELLLEKGITTDISLEKERIDAPFGVAYYAWIPVEDHTPPHMDQFQFGVQVLESIIKQGRKVYVHCKNGHGRAPTLVAAYLISTGKTPEEAVAFIKDKRSSIHLEDVQKKALQEFALLTKGT
jgi:protein-tyrosine phosphatase